MCNKQMVLCLLIGLILAIAMVSSVPIYTNGVLQRMLIKDLENYQINSNRYPGTYTINQKLYNLDKKDAWGNFNYYNKQIPNKLFPQLDIPALAYNCHLINDFLSMIPEDMLNSAEKKNRNIKIEAMNDFFDHIKILQGELPSNQKEGDTYEVIISEESMQKLDVILGKTYVISSILQETAASFKIKIVGVFTNKDNKDPYWIDGKWQFVESVIMNYDLFQKEYMEEEATFLTEVQWFYALDYYNISVDQLKNLVKTMESQTKFLRLGGNGEVLLPAISIFRKYEDRAKLLKTTLWVLQMPILLMILFYLFMVSQLIIEQEKNEIAVLKSRGASRSQILRGYIIQGLLLGFVAIIIGPLIGLLLCNILGASNGFLEFVSRTRLKLSLNLNAYLYSLIGIGVFMITMLIPAVFATGTTIVIHKQKKVRKGNVSIWKKYFIDIVLIAISLYGIYNYKNRQDILKITGVKGSEIPMDPLLFLISTLFILGMGMCFLRVFPYIVKIIFRLGNKLWGPVSYSSLINVSRSDGRDQFIMLFLILTISIGLFNANSARTINTNVEEKVEYNNGADLVLLNKWDNDAPPPSMDIPLDPVIQKPVTYMEPPFTQYEKIDGIEKATKVFRKKSAFAQIANKNINNVYVMGIESKAFGETIWFRRSLLSYHINDYLNVMAKDPRAFLVSSSFKKNNGAKVGDSIYIKWGENDYLQGIIYAFVDYWPTFNPYDSQYKNEQQNLVVANLSYIQAKTRLEPYEIWVKQSEDATTKQVYDYIEKNNKELQITNIKNTKQNIIEKKNDAMLQGTNGALTMGFIITMVICTIGFLIFWILSIQKRTLQFGILRAMGLKLKDVIGMLIWEQVLVSGTSIFAGLIIGGIASKLFIPLLQIVYSSAEQIPPFRVVAHRGDYIKLYIIIFIMLFFAISILGRLISRIKINQAIKLGED